LVGKKQISWILVKVKILIKLASENYFYGTVDKLLQNGANPDYSNSFGFTALFYGKFFVFATIKYLSDQFIIFLSKQNGR